MRVALAPKPWRVVSRNQMTPSKRNHYNPCFWTALWNPDYYARTVSGKARSSTARAQSIFALSVKSGEVFKTSVDKIHYDKNLGVAEISRHAAEDFVRRRYPRRYDDFLRKNANAEYPVFIDFEEILTALERMPPYQVLLNVATRGSIQTAEEKVNLGCFVVLQLLRSHAVMNAMIQWHNEVQLQKFEHFVNLKWLLGNSDALFEIVRPIVVCQWTLFVTPSDSFPLCDSPVLVKPHSIMVALSPRMLLEIQVPIQARDDQCRVRRSIKRGKLAEFRRRTIGNTFREIIFGERELLDYWGKTREFRERIGLMKDVQSYNRLVKTEGIREMWELNAYGNKG